MASMVFGVWPLVYKHAEIHNRDWEQQTMSFGRIILTLIVLALWGLVAIALFRTPGTPSELDQVESYLCQHTKLC